jgi:hypothetical protein
VAIVVADTVQEAHLRGSGGVWRAFPAISADAGGSPKREVLVEASTGKALPAPRVKKEEID